MRINMLEHYVFSEFDELSSFATSDELYLSTNNAYYLILRLY